MKQPDLTITPFIPLGGLPVLSGSPWSTPTEQSRSTFLSAQTAQSDMLLEPPKSSKSTRRLSRRQLSYEDVRCVHVDEGCSTGGDDIYTFRVRPNALQMGSWRGAKPSRRVRQSDDQDQDQDEAAIPEKDDEVEEEQRLPPYMIKRSASDILDISSRLLSSFETLLDEKRGGPYPLSKEILQSKKNLKDFFKRRKKKVSAHEEEESLCCLYKIALVNEFFTKAIQTGGEVVCSSRAMQDFFDQSASFKEGRNDVLETVMPTLKLPKGKPVLSDLLIGDLSPLSEASTRLNTPASWRSISPFTPNSASTSNRNHKQQLWKKSPLESQGKSSTLLRGGDSTLHIPAMSDERQRQLLKIRTELESRHPRTPRDKDNVNIRSIGVQDVDGDYQDWQEEVDHEQISKRSSLSSPSSFVSPQSAVSDSDVFTLGQLKQVSGVAIKTKAIGWKFTKGSYPPNALLSKKVSTPSSDGSPLRPLLTHQLGSQVSLSCSTVSVPTDGADASPYKPSALERLIFGNEGRQCVTTSNTTSEEEEEEEEGDYFGPDALEIAASTIDDESLQASATSTLCLERRSASEEMLASPYSGSDRGEKSAYRNKGKASDLFLDLKGRSNLHTESMPDRESLKRDMNVSAFSFDDDEEEGEMQEIQLNRGPVSTTSPILTPISQQLAAIQKEAESMALFHRHEYYQIESSRSANHACSEANRVKPDTDWNQKVEKQMSAIEGEVQARQGRKLLSPR